MTKNKVPRISRSQGRVRIKGVVNYYYSPYWQRWIAKAWPRGQGADTAKRARSRAIFTNVVSLIKNAVSEDFQAAADHSAGTPLLPRDFLMKAATGTLIQFTDNNGRQWMSTRNAIQFIQPSLDSISNTPGSVLYRGNDFWDALLPPTENSLLQLDPTTMTPTWTPVENFLTDLPEAYAFLATISGNPGQNVANETETTALWNDTLFSTMGADYDASTGVLTPSKSGTYIIASMIVGSNPSNIARAENAISFNGKTGAGGSLLALAIGTQQTQGDPTLTTTATAFAVKLFNGTTDNIRIDTWLQSVSGGQNSIAGNSVYCFLAAIRIGSEG